MTCHNCLLQINPKIDSYRRIPSPRPHGKPIYIHWPHCPKGADPLAHHNRLVRKGLAAI